MTNLENRRPLKSRDTSWAKGAAALLARNGVGPDLISAGSLVFAVIGAAAFIYGGQTGGAARAAFWIGAALCIQGRLLCNLFDGLVALEFGRGGPLGPLWNELPDRVADGLFLVGAGYGGLLAGSVQAEPAGWLAAILAVLTAYVRELGRGIGLAADFSGPGAKPHRMAVLTATAVLAGAFAPTPLNHLSAGVLAAGLGLIVLLAAATCVRRTLHAAHALRLRRMEGS